MSNIFKIVGGTDAKKVFPWMVMFRAKLPDSNWSLCGGMLISDGWILTAKHCTPEDFIMGDVLFNGLSRKNDNFDRHFVEQVIPHPSLDVQLLKFTGSIDNKPISLFSDMKFPVGTKLHTMGWGLTQFDGEASDTLKRVDVFTQPDYRCTDTHFQSGKEICAGHTEGGKDSCQGDSGGPLFYDDGNIQYLVGVVSRGDECAKKGGYGYYILTKGIIQWIKNNIGSSSISTVTIDAITDGNRSDTPDTTPDTTPPDTTPPDTSPPDTSPPDTSPPDTSPPDTSQLDTSQLDTSQLDTSPPDTSPPDTSPPDTSPPDTSPPDTSFREAQDREAQDREAQDREARDRKAQDRKAFITTLKTGAMVFISCFIFILFIAIIGGFLS
jgi:trypsin